MKKMIRASITKDDATRHATMIKNKAQELLDAMENTPSGFLDANDLGALYEELIDVIPALSMAINSGNVSYQEDRYGMVIKKDMPEDFDLWEH